jgi:hypothetical protein
MKIKYGTLENVVKAHDAGIAFGGIVGYTSKNGEFGLIQWGIAKDIVYANKVASILEEMANEKNSS